MGAESGNPGAKEGGLFACEDVEAVEVALLLDAIYQRWGYDFRSFARASIERRIKAFLARSRSRSIPELMHRVLCDRQLFSSLARSISVPVTEFYRDTEVFLSVRSAVVPILRTWPHSKIWHAGCATGEEVYSMAILLKEEGLQKRATLYATDFNDEAIELARCGSYPLPSLEAASRRYKDAGGSARFSDYYTASLGQGRMDEHLREKLVFACHNLATDAVFGEMQLVMCRNVLIYFNKALHERALGLFTESLAHGGFLCLGTKEDLRFSKYMQQFEVVDEHARIYRKRS